MRTQNGGAGTAARREYPGTPAYNPPRMQVARDMIVLCKRLLAGQLSGEPVREPNARRGSCAAGAMGDGRDGIYGCGMRRPEKGTWIRISSGGLGPFKSLPETCQQPARGAWAPAPFCVRSCPSVHKKTNAFIFACGKNKTLWGKLDESPILNGIFDSYKNFLSIFLCQSVDIFEGRWYTCLNP